MCNGSNNTYPLHDRSIDLRGCCKNRTPTFAKSRDSVLDFEKDTNPVRNTEMNN